MKLYKINYGISTNKFSHSGREFCRILVAGSGQFIPILLNIFKHLTSNYLQ